MKQVNIVYLVAQAKWAQWMTKKMAKLSRTSLLVIWSVFIGISGSYSIYMIVQGFSGATVNRIKITPINKPLQLLQQADEVSKENSSADKDKFEKTIRFRAYMDSLRRSPTGRESYDIIVNHLTGLLDSRAILEYYYQSKLKDYDYGKTN